MALALSPREARTVARAQAILERSLREPEAAYLNCTEATRSYLQMRMAWLDHEQVHALYLNAQLALIAVETLSIGTLTQATLHPREVARGALRHNAAAVILAHNHPSGNAAPSASDLRLTQAVRDALELIDVRLVDHVVVTASEARSAAAGIVA